MSAVGSDRVVFLDVLKNVLTVALRNICSWAVMLTALRTLSWTGKIKNLMFLQDKSLNLVMEKFLSWSAVVHLGSQQR